MWLYENQPFTETPDDYQGFVYMIRKRILIRNISVKFFWKPKTLPVTKTRKRRVRTRVESDWRDYWGSSKEVQQLVEQKGSSNFEKIILKLCHTKGECSYYEAKLQFDYDVLLRDDFYNEFIGCKIHSKHLKAGLDDSDRL